MPRSLFDVGERRLVWRASPVGASRLVARSRSPSVGGSISRLAKLIATCWNRVQVAAEAHGRAQQEAQELAKAQHAHSEKMARSEQVDSWTLRPLPACHLFGVIRFVIRCVVG